MSINYPPLEQRSPSSQQKGIAAYILAGLAFIPLIGVGFGIGAIVVGVIRKQVAAIVAGAVGIVFTFVLYGSLFYFGMVKRGGVYDELRGKMALTMLNGTVREIEYFRQVNGRYPKTLKELEPQLKNGLPVLVDPTSMQRGRSDSGFFYYELDAAGTGYYLRSVGQDGVPFTSDDVVPDIPAEQRSKLGLRLEKEGANKAPDRTAPSVTPPAAQEPRH